MELGEMLRYLRKRSNLTQRQVTDKAKQNHGMDIQYSYIGMLERGERTNPSRDVLEVLASVYGVSPSQLLNKTEDESDVADRVQVYLRELPAAERNSLRRSSVCERVRVVLQALEHTAVLSDLQAIASRLNTTESALLAVMNGAEPSGYLLDALGALTSLGRLFWLRGKLEPDPVIVAKVMNHEEADEYLGVVSKAIDARVLPHRLGKVVDVLADNAKKEGVN